MKEQPESIETQSVQRIRKGRVVFEVPGRKGPEASDAPICYPYEASGQSDSPACFPTLCAVEGGGSSISAPA
jgi:hypothetical protein